MIAQQQQRQSLLSMWALLPDHQPQAEHPQGEDVAEGGDRRREAIWVVGGDVEGTLRCPVAARPHWDAVELRGQGQHGLAGREAHGLHAVLGVQLSRGVEVTEDDLEPLGARAEERHGAAAAQLHQDIAGLDVPVGDVDGVEVGESLDHRGEDVAGVGGNLVGPEGVGQAEVVEGEVWVICDHPGQIT